MNEPTSTHPSRTLILLAFAIIYVVWGSTYAAIRVVVETIPPFLSAAVRFLSAGLLLMLFLKLRGVPMPTRAQWKHSLITGLLLLVGGNGLVVWAEKSISSGLAALLVALAPVWFSLLDWLRPGGSRPQVKTVIGILIGFLGVVLLVNGRSASDSNGNSLFASFTVVAAGISWAAGSLFSKHSRNTGSPWMNAAAQMICGGVGLLLVALAFQEPLHANWNTISSRSIIALLYLVVFGSWIGFSAYVWLLRVSTPSRISTYAYVNPVIAVLLGWLLLGETVSARMLWGALVVVLGVIAITAPQTIFVEIGRKLRRLFSSNSARQGRGFAPCPNRD